MRLVEVEDAMGPLGWVPVPDPEPPAADPALDLAIAAEQARLKGSLGALETVAKLIQDLPLPRAAEAERTQRAESFETKVSEQREQLQELHSIQVLRRRVEAAEALAQARDEEKERAAAMQHATAVASRMRRSVVAQPRDAQQAAAKDGVPSAIFLETPWDENVDIILPASPADFKAQLAQTRAPEQHVRRQLLLQGYCQRALDSDFVSMEQRRLGALLEFLNELVRSQLLTIDECAAVRDQVLYLFATNDDPRGIQERLKDIEYVRGHRLLPRALYRAVLEEMCGSFPTEDLGPERGVDPALHQLAEVEKKAQELDRLRELQALHAAQGNARRARGAADKERELEQAERDRLELQELREEKRKRLEAERLEKERQERLEQERLEQERLAQEAEPSPKSRASVYGRKSISAPRKSVMQHAPALPGRKGVMPHAAPAPGPRPAAEDPAVDPEEEAAATKMQSAQRQRQAKQRVERLKRERDEKSAQKE